MYRPAHTRFMYSNPRDNLQFQYKPNSYGPRATNWRNKVFHNTPSTANHEEHWCETCDRSFPTLVLLQNHKQQHQKCNIDGCQFVAHPKVITKHIQMQHSSGLYKKIAKLANPEEINKWREERKKKYPTITNIEKKAAEIKEKIERGEKMGLQYDRGFKNYKSGIKRKMDSVNENEKKNNFKRNNSNFQGKNIFSCKKQPPAKKIFRALLPVDEKRRLKPFTGIQEIVMCDTEEDMGKSSDNDLIEDDLWENNAAIKNVSLDATETAVCGALSSLMCDYGSSDDENETEKRQTNKTNENDLDMKKAHIEIHQNILEKCPNSIGRVKLKETHKTICVPASSLNSTVPRPSKSDDDSGPEEVTIIKNKEIEVHQHTSKIDSNSTSVVKKKCQSKLEHRNVINRRPKPKVPSTLLRKLLFKEMRQERNIVLQCVRYIARNNYFKK